MKLEKTSIMLNILGYVLANPYCSVPEIRDFLIRDFLDLKQQPKNQKLGEKRFYKVMSKDQKKREEKDLYRIIGNLEKERYIFKLPVKKKKGSGGVQFKLKLSEEGFGLLVQLKSNKILPEKFPTNKRESFPEKEIGLNKVLNVYSGEVYDIVEATVEKILLDLLKIHFENISFPHQTEVVNTINRAVEKITEKTSEIAQLFF